MTSNQGRSLEKQGYIRCYRKIVMYGDLNAAGSIFGGTLVSWVDEATAIFAICQTQNKRIVTKKISELVFHQPASLGDLLEVWCKVVKEGNTSITVESIVIKKKYGDDKNSEKDDSEICRCELVFVALDENRKPTSWGANKRKLDEKMK